jgi:lipopolysaccharide transport system ATP-binding protein
VTKDILQAKGLSKCYRMHASPYQRMRALLGFTDHSAVHWALKDVTFELQRGQCLGVIGDNGAGKSTLLKLLAGTLQPSHGSIQRVGRLTAILELGAGFHPDFTGRENLLFSGSIIGLGQGEMQRLAEGVISYSELGEAIDRPVKTYSSGMVVRLAFALVTAVQPEVLIIDEALAVGDQHFQKKCTKRIEQFRKNGCTILFCSHSLYHVRQLCDQVMWLDKGAVKGYGKAEQVLSQYGTHVRLQDASRRSDAAPNMHASNPSLVQVTATQNWTSTGRRAGLLQAEIVGFGQQSKTSAIPTLQDSDLIVSVNAVALGEEMPSVGVMLEQYQGVGITSVASHADGIALNKVSTNDGYTHWQVTLSFPDLPLHSGQYSLSFYLFDSQGMVVYDEWKDFIQFQWVSPSLTPGLVRLPHQWS